MPKIVAQKEDWIKLGYALFTQQGEAGIVVEKIAKKLGCNKSSFYWHFKTKTDFIQSLVDYWVAEDTEKIIALSEDEDSAAAKFEKLLALSFKKDGNLDFVFYLKRYGQKDQKIQTLIDEIDQQRIRFVQHLLEQMGTDEKKAAIQAEIFYKYLIGYHEMIRYKKQKANYLQAVITEISHFLNIE